VKRSIEKNPEESDHGLVGAL